MIGNRRSSAAKGAGFKLGVIASGERSDDRGSPDVAPGLESLWDDLAGKAGGKVSMERVKSVSAPDAAGLGSHPGQLGAAGAPQQSSNAVTRIHLERI